MGSCGRAPPTQASPPLRKPSPVRRGTDPASSACETGASLRTSPLCPQSKLTSVAALQSAPVTGIGVLRMDKPTNKLYRCAIYTRKSTDHNLDLEFNSL